MVEEINLSHYRPTPDQRRFSISTFAVTGQIIWESKPGGEFSARVDVLKGALAKMIPFSALEASVHVVSDAGSKIKKFVMKSIGAKTGSKIASGQEKTWADTSILSPIEIPWVVEYAQQRWSVGGAQEVRFSFEDGQRTREVIVYFRENSDTSLGDALAVLRVLKLGEEPISIASTQKEPRGGDVLVTIRDSKITGFTVFVPLIGKLQFVAS